jgi:hypothetical protein
MTVTVPYRYIKPNIIIELGAVVMDTIKPKECAHDLRTVQHYLAQYDVDTSFYLRWFAKHNVGCDCEFILNIAAPLYDHVCNNAPEPSFLDDMFVRQAFDAN